MYRTLKHPDSPLRLHRIKLDLTPEQVAARAGLTALTIYKLEAGRRLPRTLPAIRSYARALRLSEAELRALVVPASSACPKCGKARGA